MLTKEKRIEIIINELKKRKIMAVKDLSNYLDVSEMTIRRDIAELEKNDVIEVFFGGISLKTQNNTEIYNYQIENEINIMIEEKRKIAQKAVSLLEPHDVILIDTGSTTELMLDFITDEMNQIVYCYALNIIDKVCSKPNLSVVTCGGYFHKNTRMFESQEGVDLLKRTHFNKVFMAARGITEEKGITTAEPYEIDMKKSALCNAETKILLADSTKFGKAWYAKYAELNDFDIIISDSKLKNEFREMIKGQGITLHIV